MRFDVFLHGFRYGFRHVSLFSGDRSLGATVPRFYGPRTLGVLDSGHALGQGCGDLWSRLLYSFESCSMTVHATLATVFVTCQILIGQVQPLEQLLRLYDYDAKAALDVQEQGVTERDGVKVHDLTYASPRGGRAPAFLVTPGSARRGEKFAGVVFLHWGQGDRSSFLAEAILLAHAGVVSVMMDSPHARPKQWRSKGGFAIPELERDGHVQAVVDVRRAVDLLMARPEVDPKRLAYVGHSYGASLGGAVAASERRFKALVLMGGLVSWTETYRTGANRISAEAVESVPNRLMKKPAGQ